MKRFILSAAIVSLVCADVFAQQVRVGRGRGRVIVRGSDNVNIQRRRLSVQVGRPQQQQCRGGACQIPNVIVIQ